MKQTEITVQVFDSFENLSENLKNNGYEIVGKCDLNDFYYSKYSNDELRLFSYENLLSNSFLVRKVSSETENSVSLIYKNKEIDKYRNVISEEKTKVLVDDLNKTLKIFDLGKLNRWCELTQHMTIFNNSKYEFAVQEVEGLGLFIEFEEDDSMQNLTIDEKMKYMLGVLKI